MRDCVAALALPLCRLEQRRHQVEELFRDEQEVGNANQAAGVIHDLGYRGYDGPRLGRAQIVRALTWHSFRSAWGIGRGVKGKIVPVLRSSRCACPRW